jgi:hypothetical protein
MARVATLTADEVMREVRALRDEKLEIDAAVAEADLGAAKSPLRHR